MIKQLILTFVCMLSFYSSFAQFGIQESQFLAEQKPNESISIIVKGDIAKIQAICKEMDILCKYAYQDLAAISIKKEQIDAFYQALEGMKMEIPLGQANLLMDTALLVHQINYVHEGLSPLPQAYTGKGVIIGILDSGIYFEHDDFKNPDGTTRIRYIWDQNVTIPSNPPAPYNFGQEWSWIDINAGACNHVEPANQFGHGTTVAGAACGNGLATGEYKGVAPECDIIAVAVDYYGNDFLSNTVDAIDYVFKKADALGKPCVINTSFGSYTGSHDGKDFASLLIDALLEERPGRALVAAAGNGNNINNEASNFTPTHLSYTVTAQEQFTWFQSMSNQKVFFDLWADVADFEDVAFAIGVNHDSTFADLGTTLFLNVTDFVGNLNQGVYLTRFVFDSQGNNQGKVEMYAELNEGRYNLEFLITPSNPDYLWRFVTKGSGMFDIWSSEAFQSSSDIVYENLPPNFILPAIDSYQLPDNEKCIVSSWQCSDKVITVGNFANRAFYYDVDSTYHATGLTPGEIYYKSSEGPTRDLRLKPDISASGNIIFASGNLSFIASALNINRPKVAPGAKHNYNGGTSMSSPLVAGAVALYFEANPDAWWYEVKEALIQTAVKDTFTGPLANTVYGHGKLNAFNLLQFDAVLGCMDDTMFNYNPLANVDDGSCIPIVLGCTDTFSLNFNSQANTDDGSCVPIVLGCTDSSALNFNPLANTDDGSCEYQEDTLSIRLGGVLAFDMYPNPVEDYLILEIKGKNSFEYHVSICDLVGKEILHFSWSKSKINLPLSTLTNGVYIIHIQEFGKTIASKKIIKE